MLTSESRETVGPEQAEPEARTAEPQLKVATDTVAEAEAVVKETAGKPKPKRTGEVKEPVAVA